MGRLTAWFLTALLLVVFMYAIGLGWVSSHEMIHKQIYSRYGISSEITIDYVWLSGETIPKEDKGCWIDNTSTNLTPFNNYCRLEHTLNDIIGYNVGIFLIALFSIFFLYITFKTLINTKKRVLVRE